MYEIRETQSIPQEMWFAMMDRSRELVLTQVMLSIKAPLLTHCDKSSSFFRSSGIKLYNSDLPFPPDYCGNQHLLLFNYGRSSAAKLFPICQPNLTFRVVQVIWQVRREVGRGSLELELFFPNNQKFLASV